MCEETAALGGLWQSVLGRFYGHQTSKANQTTCDPSCAQNQCSCNYLVTPMPYFVARFVNEMDQPRLKAIIAPFSATHCSHQHHNLGARVRKPSTGIRLRKDHVRGMRCVFSSL